MSNERERLAREWAEKYLRYADESDSAELYAAAQIVKANTTPPTMADVEWDGDKHFLAGAVYEFEESTCPVVMVDSTRDGEIYSVDLDENTGCWPMPGYLTPNGKKYKLVEVTGDERPETLTTVEDYENAPTGTVVDICGTVAVCERHGWGVVKEALKFSDGELFHQGEGVVLRWGWGE